MVERYPQNLLQVSTAEFFVFFFRYTLRVTKLKVDALLNINISY